jgi:hypothetical protein
MDLKPGTQLASVVCGTRVVVVKAPGDRQPVLACGGQPMLPAVEVDGVTGSIDPALAGGTQLGKRYEAEGLEVLCSAPGEGTLTCDGEAMALKSAKPLPASD